MSRVLVFGSTGFLGGAFMRNAADRVIAVDRNRHDFTKPVSSETVQFLKASGASYAIILTSISSPDDCLREPELSEAVNVTGTVAICHVLKSLGIKPVFFSTDHVFDGVKGDFNEEDAYCPVTLYGRQKVRTETFVRENFRDYLILRTSKQVSMQIEKKNSLSEMALRLTAGQKIRCAHDNWLAPSFTEDIVRLALMALDRELSGVFNVAPEKHYSRLDLGLEVADCLQTSRALVERCSIKDFGFPEVRPPRCTLDGRKLLAALGQKITTIPEGIEALRRSL